MTVSCKQTHARNNHEVALEMRKYELKATKQNGDATYNYDVIADYPIPFDEFWRNVVKIDGSWRVVFHCKNKYGKLYGDIWCGDDVELLYTKGNTYLDNEADRPLWENMKKETVVDCWANGGWGQMTYYVTFKEEKRSKL